MLLSEPEFVELLDYQNMGEFWPFYDSVNSGSDIPHTQGRPTTNDRRPMPARRLSCVAPYGLRPSSAVSPP